MASGALLEDSPQRLGEGLRQEVGPGGALKVHSDKPHLVSIGGGRLSTAVTLMPIPEGCMICIGRSNFFRFNHPAEAQLIKSILNKRISGVPVNQFMPVSGIESEECFQLDKPPSCGDQKPPLAPRNGTIGSGGGKWKTEDVPKNVTGSPIQQPMQSDVHSSPHAQKVQNERLRDQEVQRREQLRLEEILSMCAEYERQVEWEKEHIDSEKPRMCEQRWNTIGPSGIPWQQRVSTSSGGRERGVGERSRPTPTPSPGSSTTSANSSSSSSSSTSSTSPCQQLPPMPNSPTTPSVHQNRIKTNGSLPRDKRLQSSNGRACSPVMQRANSGNQARSPDEDSSRIFNFDVSSIPLPPNKIVLSNRSSNSLPRHFGGCPREVIASGDERRMNGAAYQCNSPSPQTSPTSTTPYPTYPQSPRTRIRTIAASKNVRGCCEGENRHPSGLEESVSPSHQKSKNSSVVDSRSYSAVQGFGGTLPRSSVPSSRDHLTRHEGASCQNNGLRGLADCNGTTGARGKPVQEEAEELKRERGKLLVALAAIKRKINDIERQREEALRELEMEQALLEGELSAVTVRVQEEEAMVKKLSKELNYFEKKTIEERELTYSQMSESQTRVEEANDEIISNKDPDKVEALREQLKHHQEILEAERKTYEDMEFHQLEREASWEVSREELSRDLSEVESRLKSRRHRMDQLERAREQAALAAEEESMKLKAQQELLVSRLDEGRRRLKTVEKRMQELSRQGVMAASWECSPDASSDPDESPPSSSAESSNPTPERHPTESVGLQGLDLLNGLAQGNPHRKQSQDDLDRISRVTSGAPIDVSNGGSLGRRTLESLKTIERNRQIHLVQQGSQVIEEERRRVEELKRRAQDEVRAKWEEERLRQRAPTPPPTPSITSANGGQSEGSTSRENRVINCRSLNSVGSEEDSSIAGSDVPTESASSEDGNKNRSNLVHGATAKENVESKMDDSTGQKSPMRISIANIDLR
ncbi:hypothetical protein J437_LFUL017159 [Ladona fulva]|uniref:Uncharacterized protein n=1 Tax=Ladona fulva TaxID=123851 RepID=A0A8K0PAN0_LADFU|nr:hypothetical protein J437_LFUL017159 [Ladona fulva]